MSNLTDDTSPWDIQAARDLYNISRWGAGYFDINDEGRVVARPLQAGGAAVALSAVIEEAKGRGLQFPLSARPPNCHTHWHCWPKAPCAKASWRI